MGARADGWWKDRAGAAARLCGNIAALAARDTAARDAGRHWVMVLEGRARAAVADPALDSMGAQAGLTLVLAHRSGDDTIVHIAAELGEYCAVVTADRELRRRCERVRAGVTGPRWLLGLL
jgi:hypothetical protein